MGRISRLVAITLVLSSCSSPAASGGASASPAATPPIACARAADDLISKGEAHFAHLWKITDDVDNAAEGYWSFQGDRLTWQGMPRGAGCDRIFTTGASGKPEPISNGHGVTTCSYFLPDGKHLLYSSTHAFQVDCPPRPDMSKGYVWSVHPEYDIYVRDLATGAERAFTSTWGYDAEATVSPLGDRIVFTSSRSGDLELWTCDLGGGSLAQVTHAPGYDGGAFFSHDGKWLVFRASAWTPGKEEQEIGDYQSLLAEWKVRPTRMEIMLVRPDGSDDKRIVFASNWEDKDPHGRNFDLYAIDVDGKNLERITTYDQFDSFPVFSPDAKWLVFASNRGGTKPHETNLYLAEWR